MEAERIIFTFLKSRGYRASEQALKAETKSHHKQDISQFPIVPKCESTMVSLFKALFSASTEQDYLSTFKILYEWVENSLDTYKSQLRKVLGPVLVYFYLYLVSKEHYKAAQELIDTYSQANLALTKELKSIQDYYDLESDFVQHLFNNKYVIPIDKYSLHLLTGLIEQEHLYVLLSVINHHISIEIIPEAKDFQPFLFGDEVELLYKRTPLTLGIFPDDEKGRHIKVTRPVLNPVVLQQRTTDLENKDSLSSEDLPNIHCFSFLNSTLLCVTTSEDSSLVAGGYEDSCIRVWDLLNPVQTHYNPFTKQEHKSQYSELIGHSGGVFGLSISPDKKTLVSASEDCTVRLWFLKSASCVFVYKFHTFPVWSVKFAYQGYYFASGSADRTACLWCTEYSSPIKILLGHISDVVETCFHPNLHLLFTGSSDHTIRVWEVTTGECVRLFAQHSCPVSGLMVSRNGRLLISTDEEGGVEAWDIAQKQRVWHTKLQGKACSLAVSLEDAIVAVSTEDSQLYLLSEGQEIKRFRTKSTLIYSMFTNRNLLVVGGY